MRSRSKLQELENEELASPNKEIGDVDDSTSNLSEVVVNVIKTRKTRKSLELAQAEGDIGISIEHARYNHVHR